MKAVQVMMDEAVLEALDQEETVKQQGRSAVIRMAVEAWLRSEREREIEGQYERAYAKGNGLGKGFESWEDQGEWPNE